VPTHDELMAAKDRAASVLLRLPNVTSVGIGGRVRAGQPVSELVLTVYVDAKVPSDQLARTERIPPEIEGLPTDVVQMPTTGTSRVSAAQPAPPGQPFVPFPKRDTQKCRPELLGGCQLQGALAVSDYNMGTLGCVMVSTTDATKAYALTNWHVMQGDNHQDPTIGTTKAGQPTNDESSTKCCSDIIGTLAAGARNPTTDAGLIQLQPGTQWKAEVLDIGPLAGEHPVDPDEAATHPAVRMRGAKSRLNGGRILSINTPMTVDGIHFTNVMVIVPNANTAIDSADPYFFGQPGDSGAVVVNEANKVVGVLFAGPALQPPFPAGAIAGWALPLADIKQPFTDQSVAVTVAVAPLAADGTPTAGIVNTVPGAAMVAVPRELAPRLTGASAHGAGRDRLVAAGLPLGGEPPAAALGRLQGDLEQSARGRDLVTFWLRNQHELLDLINTNRRVVVTWYRSGASGLFQLLTRMVSQPELAVPETINGQPVSHCLNAVCAVLDRFASPRLRADLAAARAALPDLGGLTYPGICSALAAG
jgi:hypothetical protein